MMYLETPTNIFELDKNFIYFRMLRLGLVPKHMQPLTPHAIFFNARIDRDYRHGNGFNLAIDDQFVVIPPSFANIYFANYYKIYHIKKSH